MLKRLLYFIITGLLSTVNHAADKNILFGTYSNHQGSRGIYLLRNDANDHWTSVYEVDGFPKGIGDYINFSQAVCSGKNCISVGSFSTTDATHPILMTSQTAESDWSQVRYITGISTKVNFLEGHLNHTSCYSHHCFATGLLKDTAGNDNIIPLIKSEDSGRSWFVSRIQLSKNSAREEMHDLACIQNYCIVSTGNQVANHFMISDDYGKSWRLNTFTLPHLRIKALQAVGLNFIAVGYYKNDKEMTPVMLVSQNFGRSFSIKPNAVFPNTTTTGFYNTLFCKKHSCLAAGESGVYPFLSLSNDDGNTWKTITPASPFPKGFVAAKIKHVNCTTHSCAALGDYHTGGRLLPLILTVQLTASPLVYQITSTMLNNSIKLRDINCSDAVCYIAGMGEMADDRFNRPMLFKSDRLLTSWHDISDKAHFPKVDNVWIEKMTMLND
ncbi:MAG: hypothetical protein H0W64_11575 [Gammaproteobacteria bacterium]|nr:hypothetical protein [Gammaproteobacteria bacterium]